MATDAQRERTEMRTKLYTGRARAANGRGGAPEKLDDASPGDDAEARGSIDNPVPLCGIAGSGMGCESDSEDGTSDEGSATIETTAQASSPSGSPASIPN